MSTSHSDVPSSGITRPPSSPTGSRFLQLADISSSRTRSRSRSRPQSPSDEAQYLTHRVRHHETLIPPDSQGWVRHHSPEPRLPEVKGSRKKKAAQVTHSPSPMEKVAAPSSPGMRTVIDYSIPSRPRLRQVRSSNDADNSRQSSGLLINSLASPSQPNEYNRVDTSPDGSSVISPSAAQIPMNRMASPASNVSRGVSAGMGAEERLQISDPPPPYFSRDSRPSIGVQVVPADESSVSITTDRTLLVERPSLPLGPSGADDATCNQETIRLDENSPPPDQCDGRRVISEYELEWEKDREAGFPLAERVRRDFERRQGRAAHWSVTPSEDQGLSFVRTGAISLNGSTLSDTGGMRSSQNIDEQPHVDEAMGQHVMFQSNTAAKALDELTHLGRRDYDVSIASGVPAADVSTSNTPTEVYCPFPVLSPLSSTSTHPPAASASLISPRASSAPTPTPSYPTSPDPLPRNTSYHNSHTSQSNQGSPEGGMVQFVTTPLVPASAENSPLTIPCTLETSAGEADRAPLAPPAGSSKSRSDIADDKHHSLASCPEVKTTIQDDADTLGKPLEVARAPGSSSSSPGGPKSKRPISMQGSPPSSFPSASSVPRPRSPILSLNYHSQVKPGTVRDRVQAFESGARQTAQRRPPPPPPPPPPSPTVKRRPPPPLPPRRNARSQPGAFTQTPPFACEANFTARSSLSEGRTENSALNGSPRISVEELSNITTESYVRADIVDVATSSSCSEHENGSHLESSGMGLSINADSQTLDPPEPSAESVVVNPFDIHQTNGEMGSSSADLSIQPPNDATTHNLSPVLTPSLPQSINSSAPSLVSSPAFRPVNPSEALHEYTDLDLLLSRLQSSTASDDPGSNYDDFLMLSSLIGPAVDPSSNVENLKALDNLPVAFVEVERRRVTKDGRVKLKLSLMGVSVDRCGVCLSQFKKKDQGVLLPCQHAFHIKCVHTWLLHNMTCPSCRTSISHNLT